MAETTETTDPEDTYLGQAGALLGTEMRTLRDTLDALEARATALEAKAADITAKPTAEFYRYAPRVSLGRTNKYKAGEVALSAHAYVAKTQTDIYFHIEQFMGYLVSQTAPDVWVSPTQKIEIGDMGRLMAYGTFFDKSGKYTRDYSLGQVFIDIAAAAAGNIPPSDVVCYQTTNAGLLYADHPMVRSEGGTTTKAASAASAVTDEWVPLSTALTCCNSETATAPSATINGKWAADLMKCWVEMAGVDIAGSNGNKIYEAWRTYILQTCREMDPDFTLVFSNRAGEPVKALTGAPAHF